MAVVSPSCQLVSPARWPRFPRYIVCCVVYRRYNSAIRFCISE